MSATLLLQCPYCQTEPLETDVRYERCCEDDPNEDFVASYKLLLDTLASKHATEGMARAAFKRHGRVLLLAERRAA